MTIRLGVSLRETEDTLMRDKLKASANFVNCIGGTNGDSPTEISRSDVDYVIRTLRNASAMSFVTGVQGENRFGTAPVRDAYFGLGHTNLIGQLDAVNGFIQKWSYPNQASTLESEHGAIANLRFLLSPIGSTTAAASLLGADVYNIFCCGRESYAGVEMEGANATYIYRPAIFDSALALNASVGWKAGMAQVIQNDSWLLNMRCTLA